MSEIEDLRRKKMELYKQRYASVFQDAIDEEQQAQQQIAQLESGLKQLMTPDALQRYSNVKLAHPEKAVQALVVMAQLLESGNARAIDDTNLKNILAHLTPQKKETRMNLYGAI